MKLDDICNQVYVVALNEAKMQNHEYITPEHFLYAALMFDIGKLIIMSSGGDIKETRNDLTVFFDEYIPKKISATPADSFEFVKMFEIATEQAHGSGKRTVFLENILSAIFNLPESFAAYIMEKNGVDKIEMLNYISLVNTAQSNETLEDKREVNLEFLERFTTNLVDKAKNNLLDPIIGREDIIERTIQVLNRRLKNNPVHVGEPGVGKTSLVEGLANKIASGEIPKFLKNAEIFYVDIGSLVAGTKYRGDFEERLIKLFEEISLYETPIVYLDEIHNIVGAGAVSGSMDATSILKPYLAKGDIRFIGSTTFEEYKKYFEKDRALSRRFQKIDVKEPNLEESVEMLNGIKHKYEDYHGVIYSEDIIKLTCELAIKHLNDRYMPDKAIDILDETGALINTSKEDENEIKEVTEKDIEKVVSFMARVPEKNISENETDKLNHLESDIKKEIFGQDAAVSIVVNAVKASRSGLNDSEKPIASLLFVGPTGVGKTEIAKQLSKNLNVKLLRFDMSEYQEKHSVARLIGSPPGYIGYEEGGLLTEAVRKTPHCVLLLDEIEKAHPDIFNLLLQIMDYGALTDNVGKTTDFRNVLIIMTSNAGAKFLNKRIIGYDNKTMNETAIDKEVERIFNPEFRNRLDNIVVFKNLNIDSARLIASKAIKNLSERFVNKKINFKLSDEARDFIARKGFSEEYGAREIVRTVEKDIKSKLVDEVLFGKLVEGGNISVSLKNEKLIIQTRSLKKKA